jgi:hypothetical protein
LAAKKPLTVQPGDFVAVRWKDHAAYKNAALVPGSLKLVDLVTYGEVMSMDPAEGKIELIQERQLDGGDANDTCVIGLGMTVAVTVFRPVGEASLPD